MEKASRKASKTLKVIVLIAIVILAFLAVFAALTYPRTVLSFPVSFTVGAQTERREFNVPVLHSWAQVQVIVESGTSLWTAKILSQEDELWSHNAVQGGQTTYNSGWMALASGNYNFTFSTIGFGTLDAEVMISTKSGFW